MQPATATQLFHLGSCKKNNRKFIHLFVQILLPITWKYDFETPYLQREYSKAARSLWTSAQHQVQHKTRAMRSSFEGPQTWKGALLTLCTCAALWTDRIIPGMHQHKQLCALSNSTARLQLSSQLFTGREICSFQTHRVQWTPLCSSSSRGKVLAWRK